MSARAVDSEDVERRVVLITRSAKQRPWFQGLCFAGGFGRAPLRVAVQVHGVLFDYFSVATEKPNGGRSRARG